MTLTLCASYPLSIPYVDGIVTFMFALEIGAMNDTVIWSSIKPSVAVVSACLPTLRPLLLYLFPRLASRAAHYEQELERKKLAQRERGYIHMGSPQDPENHNDTVAAPTTCITASHRKGDPEYEDISLTHIKVQNDLHLTSEAV